MTRTVPRPTSVFCLALLCSWVVAGYAQPYAAAQTATPVALVYVQTSGGVNVYDAAANGTLTPIAGSPFKGTTGLLSGTNGKYVITVGTNYLHSYATTAGGGIGKQVSQIDSAAYTGGDCGPTNKGGILDHTGRSVYVLLYDQQDDVGGPVECAAYQSFNINPTNGALTFVGAWISQGRFSYQAALPTITANDLYAYAVTAFGGYTPDVPMTGFRRESSGALDAWTFAQTDPSAPSGYVVYPVTATADPTNHLAVADFLEYEPPFSNISPVQLASYTIDAQGNLKSTNTTANMPTPAVNVSRMNMSPSGKLLAVAANSIGNNQGNGLQVFHFNGGAPITSYSGLLTSAPIDAIHWDNANHLYAISNATNSLYVFTVTPTSITQVTGSPYHVSTPTALVVRPE